MGPLRDVPVLQGALVRLGTPLRAPCRRSGAGRRGGSPCVRLHLGSPPRRDRRLSALPVPTRRGGQTDPVRPDPHDGSAGGGLYRLRQSAHLAQPDRRHVPSRSAGPGSAPRPSAPGSMSNPSCSCSPMRSSSWGWPGSTSRPMRAMRSPVGPFWGWVPTSRACSEVGPNRGLPGKRAGCATPPCIPWWRRNGRHVGSTYRIGSPASADEGSAGSIDSQLAHDHYSRQARPDGGQRGFPGRRRECGPAA